MKIIKNNETLDKDKPCHVRVALARTWGQSFTAEDQLIGTRINCDQICPIKRIYNHILTEDVKFKFVDLWLVTLLLVVGFHY